MERMACSSGRFKAAPTQRGAARRRPSELRNARVSRESQENIVRLARSEEDSPQSLGRFKAAPKQRGAARRRPAESRHFNATFSSACCVRSRALYWLTETGSAPLSANPHPRLPVLVLPARPPCSSSVLFPPTRPRPRSFPASTAANPQQKSARNARNRAVPRSIRRDAGGAPSSLPFRLPCSLFSSLSLLLPYPTARGSEEGRGSECGR